MGINIIVRDPSCADTLRARALEQLEAGNVMVWRADPEQERRTSAQNRFMWEMFTQIGRHENATKEAVHDFLLDECFGERYEEVAGKQVLRRPKTSKFTQHLLAQFLDWCLKWAAENSGPVMMPADYEQWSREQLAG